MHIILLAHTVPIRSTGINWGQALATWIPIVLAVLTAAFAAIRWLLKWHREQQARTEKLVKDVATQIVEGFAITLNVRLDKVETRFDNVENHLKRQDTETTKRFNRIDRNTGTDST